MAGEPTFPKFLPGTPPIWTLTQREYRKHLLTWYVNVDHAKLRGPQTLTRAAKKALSFGGREFIRCTDWPEHDRLVYAEVELAEDSRIFPMFDYVGSLKSGFAGGLVFEPPWYRDVMAYDDSTPAYSADRDIGLITPHVCHYAVNHGYSLLIEDFQRMWILDQNAVKSVQLVDQSLTYIAVIRGFLGLKRRPEEIPLEVLVDADLVVRSPKRAGVLLSQIETTLASLRRLSSDLRQSGRTFRQDVELDLLTVQVIRQLFLLLGSAAAYLFRRDVSKRALVAARAMPEPGEAVAGLAHPVGQEDWPDALVELAMGQSRGDHQKIASSLVLAANELIAIWRHEDPAPIVLSSKTLRLSGQMFRNLHMLLMACGFDAGAKAVTLAQSIDWG